MERYKIMLEKYWAHIAVAIGLAIFIGLGIACPYADIEVHHTEAAYEQN